MWQTADLQKYMGDLIEADNDAFQIIKKQGHYFGSVWYTKFDESCDMHGKVRLDQLSQFGQGFADTYILKSKIACDASWEAKKICCANSEDDLNDPFIQYCQKDWREQITYQFTDGTCTGEKRFLREYSNQYKTLISTGEESAVRTYQNTRCCRAYDKDGDINNSEELLNACDYKVEPFRVDYAFSGRCLIKNMDQIDKIIDEYRESNDVKYPDKITYEGVTVKLDSLVDCCSLAAKEGDTETMGKACSVGDIRYSQHYVFDQSAMTCTLEHHRGVDYFSYMVNYSNPKLRNRRVHVYTEKSQFEEVRTPYDCCLAAK